MVGWTGCLTGSTKRSIHISEKRIRYEKDMYDERRYNSEMNTARMMGIEVGMEKGKLETAKELKTKPVSSLTSCSSWSISCGGGISLCT